MSQPVSHQHPIAHQPQQQASSASAVQPQHQRHQRPLLVVSAVDTTSVPSSAKENKHHTSPSEPDAVLSHPFQVSERIDLHTTPKVFILPSPCLRTTVSVLTCLGRGDTPSSCLGHINLHSTWDPQSCLLQVQVSQAVHIFRLGSLVAGTTSRPANHYQSQASQSYTDAASPNTKKACLSIGSVFMRSCCLKASLCTNFWLSSSSDFSNSCPSLHHGVAKGGMLQTQYEDRLQALASLCFIRHQLFSSCLMFPLFSRTTSWA